MDIWKLKIAFCGAHGVGKTTLIDSLDIEPNKRIKEIARELLKEFWDLQSMATISKLRFQSKCFKKQKEAEERLRDTWFVSDRSIHDIYVYTHMVDVEWEFAIEFKEYIMKAMHDEIKQNNYDIVFYIPIEFELENDGVRNMDLQFQKDIDSMIHNSLIINKVPFITLKGTIEERVAQVKQVVNMCKL